jgi:hypothetical protein
VFQVAEVLAHDPHVPPVELRAEGRQRAEGPFRGREVGGSEGGLEHRDTARVQPVEHAVPEPGRVAVGTGAQVVSVSGTPCGRVEEGDEVDAVPSRFGAHVVLLSAPALHRVGPVFGPCAGTSKCDPTADGIGIRDAATS